MSVSSAIPRRERPSWVEEFDARREIDDKAFRSGCYSPFATFDLDPQGYVLACCMNSTYPLGNVGRQRLQDIFSQRWRGALPFVEGFGSCGAEAGESSRPTRTHQAAAWPPFGFAERKRTETSP